MNLFKNNDFQLHKKMAFEKLKKRRAVQREGRKIRSKRLKSLLLERGLAVFKKFGICKVIVFGSVADGVCGEMSDIDILVMRLKNSQYWDFRYELEEAVGLPIDLYTDLDDPILVEKIITRGQTLY
jgi:predicted nucleotidyltransferase